MTLEQIKSAITYKIIPKDDLKAMVVATLMLEAPGEYDVDAMKNHPEAIEEVVKEQLAHAILGELYGDRRDEIGRALNELLKHCYPAGGDFEQFMTSKERLMAAARWQGRDL